MNCNDNWSMSQRTHSPTAAHLSPQPAFCFVDTTIKRENQTSEIRQTNEKIKHFHLAHTFSYLEGDRIKNGCH